jgi:hypothetical protein
MPHVRNHPILSVMAVARPYLGSLQAPEDEASSVNTPTASLNLESPLSARQ